jgi:hypothetical protein
MDNYGFYTPPQISRIPANDDAYQAAKHHDIKPYDIIQTAKGVIFEVERANGFVISGHTTRLRLTDIDLREEGATIISRGIFNYQPALFD